MKINLTKSQALSIKDILELKLLTAEAPLRDFKNWPAIWSKKDKADTKKEINFFKRLLKKFEVEGENI